MAASIIEVRSCRAVASLPKRRRRETIRNQDSDIDRAEISFFDSTCAVGRYATPGATIFESAHELLGAMDYYGISDALVFHNVARECDIEIGNEEILRQVAGNPRLHPSWVLAPDVAGDPGGSTAMVEEMIADGVRAARLFPTLHRYPLSSCLVDEVLAALESHTIPVFVDFGNRHWMDQHTDWDAVERICTTFAKLPVVLVHEGLGAARMFLALAARCSNLYIELSYYQGNCGVEAACSVAGPEHLLFGSGMPEFDAGLPMSMVAYCQLDRERKQMIAGGNLKRLLEAVE